MLNPQHIKTFAPHILINGHYVIKDDHLRQLWHSIRATALKNNTIILPDHQTFQSGLQRKKPFSLLGHLRAVLKHFR